ncbi:MAG: hypothetical protein ACTSRQ_14385 [Candidatus Thorarchaeota archaeon]
MVILGEIERIVSLTGITNLEENVDDISFLYKDESEEVSDLISSILDLENTYPRLVQTFTLTVELPEDEEVVKLRFSESTNILVVDPLDSTVQSELESYCTCDTIQQILGIIKDEEICTPKQLLDIMIQDSKELRNQGFTIWFETTLSKISLMDHLRNIYIGLGIKQEVIAFSSVSTFNKYISKGGYIELFAKGLSSTGSIIVAIGGLNPTRRSRYVVFTNLWKIDSSISDMVMKLPSLKELKTEYNYIQKVAGSGTTSNVIIPWFFSLDESIDDNFKSILNNVVAFQTLLVLSSYAIMDTESGIWNLEFVGYTSLRCSISFRDGELSINNAVYAESEKIVELCEWIFSSCDEAKVIIARRTVPMYFSTAESFMIDVAGYLSSLVSAFHLYVDDKVTKTIEIRQKFSEYLLDWINKILNLRHKMHGLLTNTAFGGFGTVLSAIVGLLSQSFDPSILRVILFAIPIIVILYMFLIAVNIKEVNYQYSDYLKQHKIQVDYYKSILGESGVKKMVSEIGQEKLESDFKSKRNWNILFVIFVAIASFISWLYFLSTPLI